MQQEVLRVLQADVARAMCVAISWQVHLVHRQLPHAEVDQMSISTKKKNSSRERVEMMKAKARAFKTVDTHGAPGSAKDTAFRTAFAVLFSGICSFSSELRV
jgi:hypothetical protein